MSTDIKEVKRYGKFTWGLPIQWHEIGPYSILEFHPRKVEGCTVTREIDYSARSFHGWLDGKDECESWPSLETAIIGLIRIKYLGNNNGALEYVFCKGIEAPPFNKEK